MRYATLLEGSPEAELLLPAGVAARALRAFAVAPFRLPLVAPPSPLPAHLRAVLLPPVAAAADLHRIAAPAAEEKPVAVAVHPLAISNQGLDLRQERGILLARLRAGPRTPFVFPPLLGRPRLSFPYGPLLTPSPTAPPGVHHSPVQEGGRRKETDRRRYSLISRLA